ncbi:hypothetical protein QL285_005378 [Trifolium repens]|nr:hypothetical protein QL285_005378 [Trifolium repens]
MLLLITKRRGPDSDTKDEEFTLEIDSRSSFEEVKKCIENMKGIPVKKRVLWCDSCSGTQLEDNDTLDSPELNFSKLIMLVNDDKVKAQIFLCPLVEESPWQLELDLVDTVRDLEALIKENTVHLWNQELNGYAKEMCIFIAKQVSELADGGIGRMSHYNNPLDREFKNTGIKNSHMPLQSHQVG